MLPHEGSFRFIHEDGPPKDLERVGGPIDLDRLKAARCLGNAEYGVLLLMCVLPVLC